MARDLGMEVEERQIPYEELETFEEVGSCGTAAVISPVAEIHDLDNGRKFVFSTNNEAGPKSTQLFNALRAIQLGEAEDKHGWVEIIEED